MDQLAIDTTETSPLKLGKLPSLKVICWKITDQYFYLQEEVWEELVLADPTITSSIQDV